MTEGIKANEPKATEVYADIIDLPHWEPKKKLRAGLLARAAQFSAFDALDGYEDMVDEEAREVGQMETLSEAEKEVLNQKLNLIADVIEDGYQPLLTFIYFINDASKPGGSYVSITERVRKIDAVGRKVQLCRKVGLSKKYMELDMDKIQNVHGELVDFIDG